MLFRGTVVAVYLRWSRRQALRSRVRPAQSVGDCLRYRLNLVIGDFGIELSFSFTAVPGHQSMIRRKAYSMIRQAFMENGIGFAQPTVQVGGDDASNAAAAAHTLAAQKRQAAEAEEPPPS